MHITLTSVALISIRILKFPSSIEVNIRHTSVREIECKVFNELENTMNKSIFECESRENYNFRYRRESTRTFRAYK